MRATIYIDTIEDFYKVRQMADLASVASFPARNMEMMKEKYYDKPNLHIEGRPTMIRAFMEKVRKQGFYVREDK